MSGAGASAPARLLWLPRRLNPGRMNVGILLKGLADATGFR